MACDDCTCDELTAQQRAAKTVWFLARGHAFTTAEIAALTGMTRQGAWQMMERLAEQLPIELEHSRWRLVG